MAGGRRKAVVAIACAEIVFALVAVVAPVGVFPVCEDVMHCHYSYKAEMGVAAAVAAAATASILARGMEAPRLMALVTAVSGLFMILFPSVLIGVCGSPRMACHYGLLPVWNLMGGAVILSSAAMFFAAREDRA